MEVTPCILEDMFAVRKSQYTCTVASPRPPCAARAPHPARLHTRPHSLRCPAPPSTPSTSSSSPSPSSLPSSSSSSSTACLTIRRLCRALVVSACVLSVARLPTAMSAPAKRSLKELTKSPARWMTPCGVAEPDPNPGDADHGDAADAGVSGGPMSQLLLQIEISTEQASNFLNSFVSTEKSKAIFHGSSDVEGELQDKYYNWLPKLPRVDQGLPADHFDGLKVEKALPESYTNLQKFAVGLEQIVWDRNNSNNVELKTEFEKAQSQLWLVLCEMQTAMQRQSVSPPANVTRDIMEDEVRMESGDTRDWIIYRDYVNALKYTEALIKHLTKA